MKTIRSRIAKAGKMIPMYICTSSTKEYNVTDRSLTDEEFNGLSKEVQECIYDMSDLNGFNGSYFDPGLKYMDNASNAFEDACNTGSVKFYAISDTINKDKIT